MHLSPVDLCQGLPQRGASLTFTNPPRRDATSQFSEYHLNGLIARHLPNTFPCYRCQVKNRFCHQRKFRQKHRLPVPADMLLLNEQRWDVSINPLVQIKSDFGIMLPKSLAKFLSLSCSYTFWKNKSKIWNPECKTRVFGARVLQDKSFWCKIFSLLHKM